jgi:hypothetical protein
MLRVLRKSLEVSYFGLPPVNSAGSGHLLLVANKASIKREKEVYLDRCESIGLLGNYAKANIIPNGNAITTTLRRQ